MTLYFIMGCLVGALVPLVVMIPRLLGYWERSERQMDAQLLAWQKIANSVATWEQRYTRKKKATKAEEV